MNSVCVSVIIPAFNCAKYIDKAIDSALCQNVSLEIIVIDDNSTDSIDQVMQKYTCLDNVIYVKNSRNVGAAESRNKGISLAKGEYIAFLDGDDLWREGKLEKQINAMKESKAVLCTTARQIIKQNGDITEKIIPTKNIISYRQLMRHNCISCSSVLLKKEVAQKFPMHHEDSHEDYIMWLEILKEYKFACGVNEPLLLYRQSNSGKSGSKLKSAKMTYKVYRYMGFGFLKSILCFCSYAINGAYKHWFGGIVK